MVLALIRPRSRRLERRPAGLSRRSTAWWRRGIIPECAGGVMVEAAMILPIFFLLSFGGIEFGRYWWMSTAYDRAAKKAVRYAVVHGTRSTNPASCADVVEVAEGHLAHLPAGLRPASVTTPGCVGSVGARGTLVTVEIDGTFQSIFFSDSFLPAKALSASATMVVSR